MLGKLNQSVVYAYNKGYRVVNGKLISHTGKAMKTSNLRGYAGVKIRKEYDVRVHKLAAYQKYGEAMFEEGIVVRHLDGNKQNNKEENIAIGSCKDNALDIPLELRVKRAIIAATALRKFSDIEMEEIREFYKNHNVAETLERFDKLKRRTLFNVLNRKYVTTV